MLTKIYERNKEDDAAMNKKLPIKSMQRHRGEVFFRPYIDLDQQI